MNANILNRNGENKTIPVEEVMRGDHVFIRSGGKIPVDGKILTGQAVTSSLSNILEQPHFPSL